MSERLPYEQHLHQQWREVPLPDEDMAWADMKRRLKDDDDDGFIFWWRPGCGIIALLLVLLGLGWWLLKDKDGKEKKEVKEITEQVVKDSVDKKRNKSSVDTSLVNTNESGSRIKDADRRNKEEIVEDKELKLEKENKAKKPEQKNRENKNKPGRQVQRIAQKDQRPKPKNVSVTPKQRKENDIAAKKPGDKNVSVISENDTAVAEISKPDSNVSVPKKTDPVKKKPIDSSSLKKPNLPDSSKPKYFHLSAGLSVQQQLPIGGQKATPYNSLGRKGSLLDYIPSVYVRLNRKEKWFLQAEFKYGAPQYTKEFTYYQEVIPDTPSGPPRFLTTTSNSLKKSFYHQLPFTFSYFVKPNWSVGGGVQWNKFYGAVSDQSIIKHNVANNTDQVLAKGIVVTKSDSSGSFNKSYFQAVLESQYRWKKFSFGARYTFGLTPYVRVILPNQPERKEKNSNIIFFLRYELWKQK